MLDFQALLTFLTSVPIKSIPIPQPQLFNLKSFSALQRLNNCHPKAISSHLQQSRAITSRWPRKKKKSSMFKLFVVCLAVLIDRQPGENLFLFNSIVIQCDSMYSLDFSVLNVLNVCYLSSQSTQRLYGVWNEKKLLLDEIINQNCLSFCSANLRFKNSTGGTVGYLLRLYLSTWDLYKWVRKLSTVHNPPQPSNQSLLCCDVLLY